MMAGRIVGAAISPLLLAHMPLALLVVSPVIAHLVLVAAFSEPIAYFSIAAPTMVAHGLLGFYLGRLQGPWIVEFLARKGIASEAKVQRLLAPMRVSAPLLVFLVPGPVVCALAGASNVPRKIFLPALVGAQLSWCFACRLFGQSVLGGIAAFRDGIVRHAIPLTVVTVLIVIGLRLRRAYRRP